MKKLNGNPSKGVLPVVTGKKGYGQVVENRKENRCVTLVTPNNKLSSYYILYTYIQGGEWAVFRVTGLRGYKSLNPMKLLWKSCNPLGVSTSYKGYFSSYDSIFGQPLVGVGV